MCREDSVKMENKLEKARKIINDVDAQMAELFVRRMRAAEMVYEHKKQFGLPILDQARENAVIEKNTQLIEDELLKGYYIDFIKNVMSVSRAYQYRTLMDSPSFAGLLILCNVDSLTGSMGFEWL